MNLSRLNVKNKNKPIIPIHSFPENETLKMKIGFDTKLNYTTIRMLLKKYTTYTIMWKDGNEGILNSQKNIKQLQKLILKTSQ